MASVKAIFHCVVIVAMLALSAFAAEPPIQLPEAPTPQQAHVLDRKYFAVMGFEFSGLAGDYTSTLVCLHGGSFHETDSWFGPHPSTARLTTESLGIFAGEAFGTYELKKRHAWLPFDKQVRRFWWVYPVASGLQHAVLTYHNMELYNQARIRH